MTLSSQTTKTVYVPDGMQTLYAVIFPLFSPQDVQCFFVSAAGAASEITDFTVEGFGTESGVYVRFATAPAAGGSLVLRRNTRQAQESAYPEGGKFPSAVVENDLDRIVGMIQEINEAVDRSLKVNVSEEAPPQSAEELYVRIQEVLADAESARNFSQANAASANQSAVAAAAGRGAAAESANDAAESKGLARKWAENPEDAPVMPERYSAFHWAQKARQNAAKGVTVSDSLDGVSTALEGVAASEWALGRAYAKAGAAEEAARAAANAARLAADEALAASQILGDIRMLPFRAEDLPARAPGWHCCNGGRYPLGSPQGRALYELYGEESGPSNYALDWGVIIDADNAINLPDMFQADGRGYFVRAVDGTTRQVGSVEKDAMQDLVGEVWVRVRESSSTGDSLYNPTGVFTRGASVTTQRANATNYSQATESLKFDASRAARTSDETRPLNIGMTPAIYLGA